MSAGGGGIHRVRIDHNTVESFLRWVSVNANMRGVMDNITAINSELILVNGDCDFEWTKTLVMGSEDAWYIEDSDITFTRWTDGSIDSQCGGKIVFRNNTINIPSGSTFSGFLVGGHGYDSSARSAMNLEGYKNTFNHNSASYLYGFQYRGGTGILFDNTFLGTGTWIMHVALTNYRSCTGYDGTIKDYCDGTVIGDGNIDHGWRCKGQMADRPL